LEGGVRVTDSETGAVIADMPMDEAGFIAGVDRALRRERAKTGADPVGPVRLVRWIDGRMSVIDPASGWQIELMGFGRDNLKAFARLLEPGATSTGSRG
jgi:putative photosynthetic complex assembly protein